MVSRPWSRARRARAGVGVGPWAGRDGRLGSRRLLRTFRRLGPWGGGALGLTRRSRDHGLARRRGLRRRGCLRTRAGDHDDRADARRGVACPDRRVGTAGRGCGGHNKKDCGGRREQHRRDSPRPHAAHRSRRVARKGRRWNDPVEGDFQPPFEKPVQLVVFSARHANSLPVLKTTRRRLQVRSLEPEIPRAASASALRPG